MRIPDGWICEVCLGSCKDRQQQRVANAGWLQYSGAPAANLVVAFILLTGFAFVYSATICGHPDPVDGCFQFGLAAMLAAFACRLLIRLHASR